MPSSRRLSVSSLSSENLEAHEGKTDRYFVNTKRIRTTDTETTDSSQRSLSTMQRRNSGTLMRGRMLAPRISNIHPSKEAMTLKLLYTKRKYPWQRTRLEVVQQLPEGLAYYGGGTSIVSRSNGMVMYGWNDKPIVCITKNGIYGTRPVFAGTKACFRERGTSFYPWLDVHVDDTLLLVELAKSSFDSIWEANVSLESKNLTIYSTADETIAAEMNLQQKADMMCELTVSPGVDPAVMISLSVILLLQTANEKL